MDSDNQYKRNLKVKIRSRNKVYFDGIAYSVTSKNEMGEFDILPQHANFVTLITEYIIVNKGLEDEVDIGLGKGVLNVETDRVDGYVGV